MKYLLILLMLFTGNASLHAQASEVWTKIYSQKYSYPLAMTISPSSNVLVAARWHYSDIFLQDSISSLALNYDLAGQLLWANRVNYAKETTSSDIRSDPQGNVYVSGSYITNNPEDYNRFLRKINAQGVSQWMKFYDGADIPGNSAQRDVPGDIAIGTNNYIYTTGHSYEGATSNDIVTIAYDSLGNQAWIQKFDNTNRYDIAPFMRIDNNNNLYICGSTRLINGGNEGDLLILKYSPSGVLLWSRVYNSTYNLLEFPRDMALDHAGNIYINYYANTVGTSKDIGLIKYDPSGTILWNRLYHSVTDQDEDPTGMAIDNAGNIVISGQITNSNTPLLIKYNSSGDTLWARSYPGLNYRYSCVGVDANNNIFIGGHEFHQAPDWNKCLAAMFKPNGDMTWTKTYGNEMTADGTQYFNKIQIKNGNAFLTGKIGNFSKVGYTFTIRLNALTEVQNISGEMPLSFKLSQNYPNPFNPSTEIRFDLPKADHVRLVVFNLLGQEVAILANEQLNAGTYKTSFNGSGLNSGIYFYRIESESFTETKKMLLIK